MNESTTPSTPPITLISGGQTGADRAALDVAIELGLPHGGWCPKGRLAEDGPLPLRYQLRQTPTKNYLDRTERNVVGSGATVIFCRGKLSRGSRRTLKFAAEHQRPVLEVILPAQGEPDFEAVATRVRDFVREHQVRKLNVAGSRESTAPGIHGEVSRILKLVFVSHTEGSGGN